MKGDSVKSKKGVDLRAQAEQFAAQRAAVLSDPAKPARDRAESIRDGLRSWVATRGLITEAYKGQDWIALGYTSWELYCDSEFDMKSLRLTADERNDAILSFRSVGMTTREIGAATGTSKDTASRALKASRVSGETKSPLVEALRGEIEAAAERTETSAAGPAANPEGDSPVLGEPVGVDEQASTGTQTAAEGADTTQADGAQTVRAVPEHAFLSGEAPAPDGDGHASSSGVTPEDLAEEEAVEPPVDTPAAATTSLPDGEGDPMPEQSQQPGHNSPTGLEAVQPHEDRSEASLGWGTADVGHAWTTTGGSGADFATDHHAPAGVSGVGDAPGDPPSLVELEELEDGDAAVTQSSSDPDEEATPTDLLFRLFGALMTLIDHVDAEAVGPQLFLAEVEQLHQHVDALTAFVAKVSMAQFQASQRTP